MHRHTGADRGEKAMVFCWPAGREGVVLLTNGANGFKVIVPAAVPLAEGTDFQHFLRHGG